MNFHTFEPRAWAVIFEKTFYFKIALNLTNTNPASLTSQFSQIVLEILRIILTNDRRTNVNEKIFNPKENYNASRFPPIEIFFLY